VNKEIKIDGAHVSIYTDKFSSRVRIDDYSGSLTSVLAIVEKELPAWVEKVIIKSRPQDVEFFNSKGFENEAHVNNYFLGTDMFFLTKYLSLDRQKSLMWDEEEMIAKIILKDKVNEHEVDISSVRVASKQDSNNLADLYRDVFPIYPTPLNDPNYLNKTMEEGTVYAVIYDQGKIISAASAEINQIYMNAELTDCASLPDAQGKGHMKRLLYKLELILGQQQIHCLYTIARARSVGMNKAFHQLGYHYGGRLKNNLIIYSGLEDMNVWYKNV